MKKGRITCGAYTFDAEFFETKTTELLFKEMPVSGTTNLWGEEIYFPLNFSAELEPDAVEEVEVGTLAYWPPTSAFCIFFGPTPVSTSEKPRGYSAVNVIGRINGNLKQLKTVSQGENILVELL